MGVSHKDQPWSTVDADFGFGPVTVFFRKMNIWERRAIRAAREKSVEDFAVDSLFFRARNEAGLRLWTTSEDREKIERDFDADEVDRVIGIMYGVPDEPGN